MGFTRNFDLWLEKHSDALYCMCYRQVLVFRILYQCLYFLTITCESM